MWERPWTPRTLLFFNPAGRPRSPVSLYGPIMKYHTWGPRWSVPHYILFCASCMSPGPAYAFSLELDPAHALFITRYLGLAHALFITRYLDMACPPFLILKKVRRLSLKGAPHHLGAALDPAARGPSFFSIPPGAPEVPFPCTGQL